MILPLLMGSLPADVPMVCLDCGAYFWLGLILGVSVSILCAFVALHFLRR